MRISFPASRSFGHSNLPQRARRKQSANLKPEQLESRELMTVHAGHHFHFDNARLTSIAGFQSHAQILRMEHLHDALRSSTLIHSTIQFSPFPATSPTGQVSVTLPAATQTTSPTGETQVPRLVQSNPSGPLGPNSGITLGLQVTTPSSAPTSSPTITSTGTPTTSPTGETQVPRLVQSNPSGPLGPSSGITLGLQATTPSSAPTSTPTTTSTGTQTTSPTGETQVPRLVQSNPSGPLGPNSGITLGLQV